jgi:5-methylcytosine-specific restriction protein A
MMQGEVFKRALSAPAIDHFLTIIREGNSDESFLKAIVAVNKHIGYYEKQKEKVNRKVTLHKLRYVVEKHSAKIEPIDLATVTQEFYEGVQKSLNDTDENRNLRLLKASKVPAKTTVTTSVFRRNYDVVATVLKRAKGKCELCNEAAPFIKRADKQPYLEVHHRKPLSQGGEDTIENATALCPNCHRYCHFGV